MPSARHLRDRSNLCCSVDAGEAFFSILAPTALRVVSFVFIFTILFHHFLYGGKTRLEVSIFSFCCLFSPACFCFV